MLGKISDRGKDPITDRPSIDAVRELTPADVAGLVRAECQVNPVKKLRDSHHMIARLFAIGLRPGEVAKETGYSNQRICTIQSDPAFQELVAHYRTVVAESFVDGQSTYYETVSANRRIAARLINDKLSDIDPDDVSLRDLVLIHSDAADRTGFPKRKEAINVNLDFASMLDKAITRSQAPRLIEAQPTNPGGAGSGEQQVTPPGLSAPQRRTGT